MGLAVASGEVQHFSGDPLRVAGGGERDDRDEVATRPNVCLTAANDRLLRSGDGTPPAAGSLPLLGPVVSSEGSAVIFQVRTDNHIRNSAEFTESIRANVEAAIGSRFGDRLRRVEVYLEDTNGEKGGVDTRCSVEIHLAGRPAVVAEDRAGDVDTAVDGALEKVLRVIEHQLGRQEGRAGHTSASGDEGL
jgi:ribosome-associated translation inhibitor RaiA